MISAGDFFFFFHLQGLISRTPDCNCAVLENVLDFTETRVFYETLSRASFDDMVKLLKNPDSSDSSSSCTLLWILEPILLQARKFHI